MKIEEIRANTVAYCFLLGIIVVLTLAAGGCVTTPMQVQPLVTTQSTGMLSTEVVFGQFDADCNGPQEGLRNFVNSEMRRLSVPSPQQFKVKMLNSSSLCEGEAHRFLDGPPHLAKAQIVLGWDKISSEQLFQAKELLKSMRQ